MRLIDLLGLAYVDARTASETALRARARPLTQSNRGLGLKRASFTYMSQQMEFGPAQMNMIYRWGLQESASLITTGDRKYAATTH